MLASTTSTSPRCWLPSCLPCTHPLLLRSGADHPHAQDARRAAGQVRARRGQGQRGAL